MTRDYKLVISDFTNDLYRLNIHRSIIVNFFYFLELSCSVTAYND